MCSSCPFPDRWSVRSPQETASNRNLTVLRRGMPSGPLRRQAGSSSGFLGFLSRDALLGAKMHGFICPFSFFLFLFTLPAIFSYSVSRLSFPFLQLASVAYICSLSFSSLLRTPCTAVAFCGRLSKLTCIHHPSLFSASLLFLCWPAQKVRLRGLGISQACTLPACQDPGPENLDQTGVRGGGGAQAELEWLVNRRKWLLQK